MQLTSVLLAGLPLAAQATEPAARPVAVDTVPVKASAAAERDAAATEALADDLAFLEFLGEAADGDQAFDDFLLSREFDREMAKSDKARPVAAKDGER